MQRGWLVVVMNWTLILVIAALVIAGLVVVSCSGNTNSAVDLIKPQEYMSQFVETDTPHLLIDVRTPAEFQSGAIPGAINIPVDTITQHLDQIPQDQPVVLYCRSGNRSNQAAKKLAKEGYDELFDLGGIMDRQSAGLPVQ